MGEDIKKRGRPKKETVLEDIYSCRLDRDDAYKFEMICFDEDRSRGDVMREAIKMLIESRKYR